MPVSAVPFDVTLAEGDSRTLSHHYRDVNAATGLPYAGMLFSSADGPYSAGTGMLFIRRYTQSCARW